MQLIIDLFAPLLDAIDDKRSLRVLIAELGWEVELNDAQAQAFRDALGISEKIQTIAGVAADIIETGELDAGQADTLVSTAIEIFELVQGYADGSTLGSLAQLPSPFDTFSEGGSWQKFAVRLPDYLITNWLSVYYPVLYEGFFALDLISEAEQLTDGQPNPRLPIMRSINWDLLEPTLADPVAQIRTAYAWETQFDLEKALGNLSRLLEACGLYPPYRSVRPSLAADWMPGYTGDASAEYEVTIFDQRARFGANATAAGYASLIFGTLGDAAGLNGLALTNMVSGNVRGEEELREGIFLVLEASGDANRAIDFRMRPSGLEVITREAGGNVRLALEGRPDSPWRLIGKEGKAGLELAQFTLSAETSIATDGADIEIAATTAGPSQGLRVIIAPGDGDGFIGEIFGETEFAITGDIGARWSRTGGFHFDAGVGFDVLIPVDVTLGPIGIDSLRLKLLAGPDGVTLDTAVTGGLDIAVMQVTVEEIGVRATVTPLPDSERPGNLGPLDLALKFLPPKGMGLTIDASGLVTGGGYLFHDAEAGEYAGVGQISFTALKLTAIGMLSTRLPDGEPGWSLFLSVFSEFPPIQLGFGITLNGVGGLTGLHRTFDDEALRERLKDGALESIMFPADPIANAPQILSDLRAIFPSSQGQFVFGVMCRLGWGTPQLVTVDLGVLVEFPDPIKIALLGRLAIALPDPEIAIIELNMDVFGVVNLTEKTFKLDATLRDSHVLHLFELSGDMAMRMSWGDQPNVLISMGGFHPDFVPPEGTPSLSRLRAALPLGDKASVELSAYTAITSNTFQAGGRLDIWVRVSGFDASGWLSFDALIQFAPFGFEFRVTFGVSVKKGETTLMGVDVVATVTGPGLWIVDGTASFKFLGVKQSINVYVTVGHDRPAPQTITMVADLVYDALSDPEAVRVVLPEQSTLPVALVESGGSQPILPSATLQLWQKVAPFNLHINKFGTGGVDGPNEFSFESLRLGDDDAAEVSDDMVLKEWFGKAAFVELTDAQKLAEPSYALYDAGLAINPSQRSFGSPVGVDAEFETVTIDPENNVRFPSAGTSNAASPSGARRPGRKRIAPRRRHSLKRRAA